MRSLVVHFAGGTEATIETEADPAEILDALQKREGWLVVEDLAGEKHYLSVAQITYLTFTGRKGVGFAYA